MKEEKKKSKLKIIIPIVIAIVIIAVVGIVILKEDSDTSNMSKEPTKTTETSYMSIDGIYVDNSYQDESNPNLKLVYLFYTAFTNNENLKLDSKSATITINGVNEYKNTQTIPQKCKYMSSYYYSDYLKDVYVGDKLKIVETFEIPQSELSAGKTITLKKLQLPETDNIYMFTDDIIFCDNEESIAKQIDAEGYASEMDKRADADSGTISRVNSELQGYYYSFYVNSTSYRLEFSAPNNFSLTTAFGTNSGTYSIKKGYIIITYPDTGYSVEIPYSWKENGSLELDTTTAFDVKK